MGWVAFDYDVSGFLYFDTTRSLTTAWTDQYLSGANGDGNLFYPGGPDGLDGGPAIGGEHAIPLESVRLKRLRDGVEDYEYLRALAARRGRPRAAAAVGSLFGPRSSAAYSTSVSQSELDQARCSVAVGIDPGAQGFCNRSATTGAVQASATPDS